MLVCVTIKVLLAGFQFDLNKVLALSSRQRQKLLRQVQQNVHMLFYKGSNIYSNAALFMCMAWICLKNPYSSICCM